MEVRAKERVLADGPCFPLESLNAPGPEVTPLTIVGIVVDVDTSSVWLLCAVLSRMK